MIPKKMRTFFFGPKKGSRLGFSSRTWKRPSIVSGSFPIHREIPQPELSAKWSDPGEVNSHA